MDEEPGFLESLGRALSPQAAMRADIRELRDRLKKTDRGGLRNRLDQTKRLEAIESELGELQLLSRALLSVLQEKGGVKWEDILAAMQRIDAEDGVVDGRVTPPPEVRPLPDPSGRKRGV